MAEKKGGGHSKSSGGGGGGGGGGHSVEKAKAAVESALGLTEVAAYNLLPVYFAGRSLFIEAGSSQLAAIGGSAYIGGLLAAFIYSFGKEMLSGVLDKLAGGGH